MLTEEDDEQRYVESGEVTAKLGVWAPYMLVWLLLVVSFSQRPQFEQHVRNLVSTSLFLQQVTSTSALSPGPFLIGDTLPEFMCKPAHSQGWMISRVSTQRGRRTNWHRFCLLRPPVKASAVPAEVLDVKTSVTGAFASLSACVIIAKPSWQSHSRSLETPDTSTTRSTWLARRAWKA